jgi:hypothetical protein
LSPGTLECGQPFHIPDPGVLTLAAHFPGTVSHRARTLTGTVDIVARVEVRGVATPYPDVFLTRDGQVATMPMPQDTVAILLELVPGTTKRLPACATLTSCAPGAGAVPPGAYLMYARVVLVRDDGVSLTSFGGPWPLDVR